MRQLRVRAATSLSYSSGTSPTSLQSEFNLSIRRQISQEEAQLFAKNLGLVYIEVSAKTGQNVAISFEMITERIIEKIDKKEINPEEEVVLD